MLINVVLCLRLDSDLEPEVTAVVTMRWPIVECLREGEAGRQVAFIDHCFCLLLLFVIMGLGWGWAV